LTGAIFHRPNIGGASGWPAIQNGVSGRIRIAPMVDTPYFLTHRIQFDEHIAVNLVIEGE